MYNIIVILRTLLDRFLVFKEKPRPTSRMHDAISSLIHSMILAIVRFKTTFNSVKLKLINFSLKSKMSTKLQTARSLSAGAELKNWDLSKLEGGTIRKAKQT